MIQKLIFGLEETKMAKLFAFFHKNLRIGNIVVR